MTRKETAFPSPRLAGKAGEKPQSKADKGGGGAEGGDREKWSAGTVSIATSVSASFLLLHYTTLTMAAPNAPVANLTFPAGHHVKKCDSLVGLPLLNRR